MSTPDQDPARRRAIVVLASSTALTAAAPILMHHTGTTNWSDLAEGLVVGVSLGFLLVLSIFAIRNVRQQR
jgi:hypothetical protein